LPYETFEFETPLAPEVVQRILASNVEPRKRFRSLPRAGGRPFEGQVGLEDFRIRRVSYRNSFVPIAEGRLDGTGAGTRVSVRMRLGEFAEGFVLLWMAFAGCAWAFGLHSLFGDEPNLPAVLIPTFMLTAGYLTMILGFRSEVRKTKALLVNTIGSKSAQTPPHTD
jgi:hypothetical protein